MDWQAYTALALICTVMGAWLLWFVPQPIHFMGWTFLLTAVSAGASAIRTFRNGPDNR